MFGTAVVAAWSETLASTQVVVGRDNPLPPASHSQLVKTRARMLKTLSWLHHLGADGSVVYCNQSLSCGPPSGGGRSHTLSCPGLAWPGLSYPVLPCLVGLLARS